MRRFSFTVVVALTLLAGLIPTPAASSAAETGTSSPNVTHIKNIKYQLKYGRATSYGTDLEFAKLNGRRYAFAGTYDNGLQIIDITYPRRARKVATYDCGILQGDVQIFKQGTKTFATYTAENTTAIKVQSRCVRELAPKATAENAKPAYGTYIIDVTNPLRPKSAGFISVPEGSHNGTVHPNGKFFYNSNSNLYTNTATDKGGQPGIEVYNISDVTNPRRVGQLDLPFVPASLGTESHDITFGRGGDRAYSAALSQGVIINTERPGRPKIISTIVDPAINVWHQADPVMLGSKDHKRKFLIVEDEYAGAAAGPHCPSGGVHVYEITGRLEQNPRKVGYWNVDDVGPTSSPTDICTAHVFDIHARKGIMTMAFYNGGVRVIDVSGLAGIGLGDRAISGSPMKEIGSYRFPDSDTWAVKTPKIRRNGDFFMYGNDMNRGLDVYRFDAQAKRSASAGTWMTPAQNAAVASPKMETDYKPFCLLPQ